DYYCQVYDTNTWVF
nr:immunoglobulin light chain junction region [Macaca mulatta]